MALLCLALLYIGQTGNVDSLSDLNARDGFHASYHRICGIRFHTVPWDTPHLAHRPWAPDHETIESSERASMSSESGSERG